MTAATQIAGTTMLRQQLARLFAAYNERDIPKVLGFFADDVVWTQPLDGVVVGRAEAERVLQRMFRTMPDLQFPVEEQAFFISEDGKHAVTSWRMVGTMTGAVDPPGYQPTGRTASVRGACLYEFRDGLIERHTVIYDGLDLLQQLGLMPATDSLPTKLMAGAQSVTTRLTHAFHNR